MRSKKPAIVSIIGLTTFTIIFWIAYEVYLVLTTKPAETVDPKILEPINPTLDIGILDDLSGRLFFEEGAETNAIFSPIEGAPQELTPTPEPTATVSPSPTPTITPTATPN